MSRKNEKSTRQQALQKNFRPGPEGTCEAHVYEFSNERSPLADGLDPEKDISTTIRIAGSSLLEAVEYMARFEPDFRIVSARNIGLIVVLSGTPYN
jgi:hypothetical protein